MGRGLGEKEKACVSKHACKAGVHLKRWPGKARTKSMWLIPSGRVERSRGAFWLCQRFLAACRTHTCVHTHTHTHTHTHPCGTSTYILYIYVITRTSVLPHRVYYTCYIVTTCAHERCLAVCIIRVRIFQQTLIAYRACSPQNCLW